ncbi:Rab1a [Hexamita inflata]|uniref:Rab1a n=1 Tax=Hexamita inflata TaxID=28002 RepID=A0AA86V004_9EUKA|nr:Rab1a [Hexamita inflata]
MSNTGKEVRLVMLGDSSVGKTSLLYRYMSDCFYDNPASTITASFYKKKIYDQTIPTNLQLWDTAGQEKYQSITPLYYRNADIIFIVFSVDSFKSFERAARTIDEVHSHKNQPNIILLGNKSDLENKVKEQAGGVVFSHHQLPVILGLGVEWEWCSRGVLTSDLRRQQKAHRGKKIKETCERN